MNLNQNINNLELVFVDVETTGLSPAEEFVCEIGAVKVKNHQIIGEYTTLVAPPKPMPYNAYRVHGISDEDLETAPRFFMIAREFLSFLGNGIFCAYNAPFDAGFINHELCRIHQPQLAGHKLDVLPMARATLALPKYNLTAVAGHLKLKPGSFHRALDDALTTWEVFSRLTRLIGEPCTVGAISMFFV